MDWLRGDHRWLGWLALAILITAIVWLALRSLRKPKATPYGANPNPTNISDEMWWLWQQLQALEPSSKLGGIFANKPGYHNCRSNLPSYDYSVCDNPPDQGGPSNKAAAIDWTFPDAQAGNYTTIAKYTNRLLASAKDLNDPRLNGWREFYGNADDDSYVEGWDCRYYCAATSDSSHLWHLHISENRDMTTNKANKEALLSVLKGETTAQWLGAGTEGDGAVLLNCPYDPNRLDLFLVGPTKSVVHRYWTGGMNTAWSGNGVKHEDLGGAVEVGTLTAAWAPDGNSVNIAALGKGDANTPDGCGQYWGMNLGRSGARTGWGSFEDCYGKLPAYQPAAHEGELEQTSRDWTTLGVAVCALVLAVLAVIWIAVELG
jgi:hypothetical protein